MKIAILAVGRLKAGPERDLFERYLERAAAAGRRLGLSCALNEFPESRAAGAEARKDQEAELILAKSPTAPRWQATKLPRMPSRSVRRSLAMRNRSARAWRAKPTRQARP